MRGQKRDVKRRLSCNWSHPGVEGEARIKKKGGLFVKRKAKRKGERRTRVCSSIRRKPLCPYPKGRLLDATREGKKPSMR